MPLHHWKNWTTWNWSVPVLDETVSLSKFGRPDSFGPDANRHDGAGLDGGRHRPAGDRAGATRPASVSEEALGQHVHRAPALQSKIVGPTRAAGGLGGRRHLSAEQKSTNGAV